MKKYILLLSILTIASFCGFSQNMYDALRYSQLYYEGTARSMGLGNAMVSLGGDLGALSYNPAASGVYRYSEFAITPAIIVNSSNTDYLGNNSTSNKSRFSIANVGWVGGIETGYRSGLKNINFAITANQTNSFNFLTTASGSDAQSSYLGSLAANMPDGVTGDELTMTELAPSYPFAHSNASWGAILAWNAGLIDTVGGPSSFYGATENITSSGVSTPAALEQTYRNVRSGYIQDFIFNASGNFDDIVFVGLSVTMQNIWFSEYSSYSEETSNPQLFQTGFRHFTAEYSLNTSGLGVNVKGGVIVRPVAGLTLGASISTPTWIFLNDSWEESIEGFTDIYGPTQVFSPTGAMKYRVRSPFRWSLGAGYTFGKKVAIGIDYERADYSSMKMADEDNDRTIFTQENQDISRYLKATNNFRFGLEYNILPEFAIRAGYNYYDNSTTEYKNARHYASAGIGYRDKGGFFIDLAYIQQCNKNNDSYTLYDSYEGNAAHVLDERYYNWKLALTLGVRF